MRLALCCVGLLGATDTPPGRAAARAQPAARCLLPPRSSARRSNCRFSRCRLRFLCGFISAPIGGTVGQPSPRCATSACADCSCIAQTTLQPIAATLGRMIFGYPILKIASPARPAAGVVPTCGRISIGTRCRSGQWAICHVVTGAECLRIDHKPTAAPSAEERNLLNPLLLAQRLCCCARENRCNGLIVLRLKRSDGVSRPEIGRR